MDLTADDGEPSGTSGHRDTIVVASGNARGSQTRGYGARGGRVTARARARGSTAARGSSGMAQRASQRSRRATQRALAVRGGITRRTARGGGGQRVTQATGEAEAQGQSD